MIWVLIAGASAVAALAFAAFLAIRLVEAPNGSKAMAAIADAMRTGADAFLIRGYSRMGLVVVAVGIFLGATLGTKTAAAYLAGAILTGLASVAGARIAAIASSRAAHAAESSLNAGLRSVFSSSTVAAMTVAGLALLGIAAAFLVVGNTSALAGFALGASFIAFYARAGGGVFTAAVDVGVDLADKVGVGIPAGEARSFGVISSNVGRSVGGVAGPCADLFESSIGSIVAAIALSASTFGAGQGALPRALLPLAIAAAGIVASIVGTLVVSLGDRVDLSDLLAGLRRGVIGAVGLVVVFSLAVVMALDAGQGAFIAAVAGLVAGVFVGLLTEYHTAPTFTPTQRLAEAALAGPASAVMRGLATGLESVLGPVVIVATAMLVGFAAADLYGVALAAVGMLSTLGVTLAIASYGPIADGADGIARVAQLPPDVRQRTGTLAALGCSTAATGQGFAIAAAALTAFALMAAYANAANIAVIGLLDVRVVVALMIGGLLPFLVSALAIGAARKGALAIVQEIRRQLSEHPTPSIGTMPAGSARWIDVAATATRTPMIVPGLLAVLSPLVVGFGLGKEALGGMLAGAIAAGFPLAIAMTNGGGAWENAMRLVEDDAGSETHRPAMVADTIGRPLKGAAGSSINGLIKLMPIVALVFASIFARL